MKVKIRLSGLLAASMNFNEKMVELPEGTTVAEAMKIIELPVSGAWTRCSVNGRLRDKNYILEDGDDLFFFPVGGGG